METHTVNFDHTSANAVALYPHLVKEVADKRGAASGPVDAREVFQVLLIRNQTKLRWVAVLAYGVPRIKSTLATGIAELETFHAIASLLRGTSDALTERCQEELHISRRDQTGKSVSEHATFDKQFL